MLALALSGCGGGSVRTAPTAPTTNSFGNVSVTYTGHPTPFTVNASLNSVRVSGMAGASFTNITLNPPNDHPDTQIAEGDPYVGMIFVQTGSPPSAGKSSRYAKPIQRLSL